MWHVPTEGLLRAGAAQTPGHPGNVAVKGELREPWRTRIFSKPSLPITSLPEIPVTSLHGSSNEGPCLKALHGLALPTLQPRRPVPSGLQRPEALSHGVLCSCSELPQPTLHRGLLPQARCRPFLHGGGRPVSRRGSLLPSTAQTEGATER